MPRHAADAAFGVGRIRLSSVSPACTRPLRSADDRATQVSGRAADAAVVAGTGRPGPTERGRTADRPRQGFRRRRMPPGGRARCAVPDPDPQGQRRPAVDAAADDRRRLRIACLSCALLAAALAAGRRDFLRSAGGGIHLGHAGRAAGAVLPGRAPKRQAGDAGRRAVDTVLAASPSTAPPPARSQW
jgi:hypothetical protein